MVRENIKVNVVKNDIFGKSCHKFNKMTPHKICITKLFAREISQE